MKTKIFAIILCFFIVTAFAPENFAVKDSAEERIAKKFPAKGITEISIDNFSGSVDIRTSKTDMISVEALKSVQGGSRNAAADYLKDISVDMEVRGSVLEIITDAPEIHKRFFSTRSFSRSVKISVSLPAELIAMVYNKYGRVSVSGVKEVDINNTSGRTDISNIAGKANLNNSYNPVKAENIGGNLTCVNKSGTVEARTISGMVDIEASYNKVTVTDAKKSVFINNKSGAVDVRNTGGDCEITNSYNKVSVYKIGGKLTVDSQSADVLAEDITGSFSIRSSYNRVEVSGAAEGRIVNKSGTVFAENIKGDLYIESSYNPVTAENIDGRCEIVATNCTVSMYAVKGDADVETSYNSVKIQQVDGEVSVRNKSGSVEVRKAGKDVTVRNSYNPVELYDITGSADIEAPNGRVYIDGAADVDVKNTYNEVDMKRIRGSVNASAQSGRISADILFSPKANYIFETSYSNIEVTFAGELSAVIRATVPKGNEIEFIGPIDLERSSGTKKRLEGKIGAGESQIDLTTRNSGSIYIRTVKPGNNRHN